MFLEVTQAEYLEGYKVMLLFNNGERRIVDLSSSLQGEIFAPFKDQDYITRPS
ncbi:MAG: DUF2442 domain-containing protein [Prevotellaceae bacterium]|nr:DUF2442 domain-containing protein [Prevotellaceae bacterium]